MTAPRTYEQLVGDLREALTGSRTLGSHPDTVVDRLHRALDAAWNLAAARGIADRIPVIAGTEGGPWTPGGPRTLLADAVEQTVSRFRHDDASRWRSLAEAARQLEVLVAALAVPDAVATPPPSTPAKPSTPSAPSVPAAPSTRSWPDALWVGRWDPKATAVGGRPDPTSTYASVQWERPGAKIVNSPSSPRVPIVDHPALGRCLRLSLPPGVQRHEVQAEGSADSGWNPGTERWFGFRFALAGDFPLSQRDTWAIISQVHQSSHSGPPPLELDACRGGLYIRGGGDDYLREVCDLRVGVAYDVLVGLRIGRGRGGSRVDVVVDGRHLVREYAPPLDFGSGCYWKTASAYARPSIRRPWTVFQRDHRIGRTRASIT